MNTDLNILAGAYHYFLDNKNHTMALQVASKVIKRVQQTEALPEDWEQLKPLLILRRDDPAIRLLLDAYATSGLVWVQLGDLQQATAIARKICEVSPEMHPEAHALTEATTTAILTPLSHLFDAEA